MLSELDFVENNDDLWGDIGPNPKICDELSFKIIFTYYLHRTIFIYLRLQESKFLSLIINYNLRWKDAWFELTTQLYYWPDPTISGFFGFI